jgi:two-component system chemotaxis response regulator CheY
VKILVVDDSKAMRMIVKRTIRKAGFTGHEFIEASNGAEAYKMITGDNVDNQPDLVMSDWNMPRMTGIDLAERLQREDVSVPFGFVTSEGTKEMRDRASNAGALFLIAKPFTVASFEEALGPLIPSLETTGDAAEEQ